MQFIYITDFHGDIRKYEKVFDKALKLDVKLIVNGGDICPHRGSKNFLRDYFPGWLEKCKDAGIINLGMFGNDDPKADLIYLDELVKKGLFTGIDLKTVDIEGWKLWGYNYVPDYPFALKDWVKLDYEGAVRPGYFGRPVESSSTGYLDIEDIDGYFNEKGTIAEELENISLSEPEKTIVVTHSPPQGTGLDVCFDGRVVGSKSVYEFIRKQQPVLSLHGHIHESPRVTGVWKTNIGKTLACQPGPEPVLIDIDEHGLKTVYL